MTRGSVVIELWPGGVAVTRSGRTRLERTITRSDWGATPWTEGLSELAAPLDALIAEARIKGARVTVVYAGAGSVATVVSCPAAAGASNTERAAQLALTNAADFAVDDNPLAVCELLRERGRRGPAAAPELESLALQSHLLAAADAPESTERLVTWLTARGVTPTRLVPMECVALAEAVRGATAGASSEPRAVLWMGPTTAALAAGVAGRLLFVRTIAVGASTFVDALCRPMNAAPDAPPCVLSRERALQLLLAVGLPASDTPLPGGEGLTGAAVLPHLQPIVQRLAVETKQSLRFGIPESLRTRVHLHVVGPFGAIPNLGGFIARSAGIAFATDTAAPSARSDDTLIARSAESLRIDVSPTEIRLGRSARRMRTMLAAGVMIAGVLVALDYTAARKDLDEAESALSKLKTQASATQGPGATLHRLMDAQRAARSLDKHTNAVLGPTAAWPELLAFLGHAPEYVRILAVDVRGEPDKPTATIVGRIRYEDAADAPAAVNRFIAELSQLPIVDTARLAGTQRTTSDGHDVQEFELSVSMLKLPAVRPTGEAVVNAEPAPTSDGGAP